MFPLIKEIVSRKGVLHFRRWALIDTARFAIYLHYIAESDQEAHEHTHPRPYYSLILKGGYTEMSRGDATVVRAGSLTKRLADTPHKITLFQPTWTLFISWGPRREWGYEVDGKIIPHEQYRRMKHEGCW